MKGLNKLSVNGGILRFVTSNLHTLSLDRIFTKGLNGDNQPIGNYTPFTIKKKKEKSRFTSTSVNLQDSGKLRNSYVFTCTDKECKLGFIEISRGDGETNTSIKKKLEEQYGDNLFSLTQGENREIDNLIGDFMDKIFR